MSKVLLLMEYKQTFKKSMVQTRLEQLRDETMNDKFIFVQ